MERYLNSRKSYRNNRKGASDGMIIDNQGNIYAVDYEDNIIWKISSDIRIKTILYSKYTLGTDTLTIIILYEKCDCCICKKKKDN